MDLESNIRLSDNLIPANYGLGLACYFQSVFLNVGYNFFGDLKYQ